MTDRILRNGRDPKKGRKMLIGNHPIGRLEDPRK
jgi:hypothetical protein